MIDAKRIRDYVFKVRNHIFTAQIGTSLTDRQFLTNALASLRNAAEHQQIDGPLVETPLDIATLLDFSSAYWEYMDEVVVVPISTRNPDDSNRVARLVYEINLLHLDLLHETFDAGMKIRVEELMELTNLRAENLPTKRNINYSLVLAWLGHNSRIVHSRRTFQGLVRRKPVISVNSDEEGLKKLLERLKDPTVSFSRNNREIDSKDLMHALAVNWMNVAGKNTSVMTHKPAPANTTAELAYLLHCQMVQVPEMMQLPWRAVQEQYQSAMEMLVLECYRWMQTGAMGPPSYSTVRSIRQLSGLSGPWDADLRQDDGVRAILTAALTLPPIDPVVIELH